MIPLARIFGGSHERSISSDLQLKRSDRKLQAVKPTTSGLAVMLPDATAMKPGPRRFAIWNDGTDALDVEAFGGGALSPALSVAVGDIAYLALYDNSTSAGGWDHETRTVGTAPNAQAAAFFYVFGGFPGPEDVREHNHQTNTWDAKSDFPSTNHSNAGSFSLGASAIVVGDNTSPQDKVDQYTPSTDTHTAKGDAPFSNASSQAEAESGMGYILGNISDQDLTASYTLGGDSWDTGLTTKPTDCFDGGAATVDGEVYTPSGDSSAGTGDDLESYDPVSDAWTMQTGYSTGATRRFACFEQGDLVRKVGGNEGDSVTIHDRHDEYNPAMNSWQARAVFPAGNRALCAGAGPEDQGHVFGGVVTTAAQDDLARYVAASDSWETRADGIEAKTSIHPNGAAVAP